MPFSLRSRVRRFVSGDIRGHTNRSASALSSHTETSSPSNSLLPPSMMTSPGSSSGATCRFGARLEVQSSAANRENPLCTGPRANLGDNAVGDFAGNHHQHDFARPLENGHCTTPLLTHQTERPTAATGQRALSGKHTEFLERGRADHGLLPATALDEVGHRLRRSRNSLSPTGRPSAECKTSTERHEVLRTPERNWNASAANAAGTDRSGSVVHCHGEETREVERQIFAHHSKTDNTNVGLS